MILAVINYSLGISNYGSKLYLSLKICFIFSLLFYCRAFLWQQYWEIAGWEISRVQIEIKNDKIAVICFKSRSYEILMRKIFPAAYLLLSSSRMHQQFLYFNFAVQSRLENEIYWKHYELQSHTLNSLIIIKMIVIMIEKFACWKRQQPHKYLLDSVFNIQTLIFSLRLHSQNG